uniref:Uncharacterized protein n=1 Tax=Peronospora matthiolae TaxID=2874970 RepID=A0AAV1UGL1_9STRA
MSATSQYKLNQGRGRKLGTRSRRLTRCMTKISFLAENLATSLSLKLMVGD